MPHPPPHARRSPLLLLAAGLCLASSGCGVLYRHHREGRQFVLHSNLDPGFLAEIGPDVEEIFQGFEGLFSVEPGRYRRTDIIFRGDPRDLEVFDLGYSPDLLGYYVPLLNLISVDTRPAWTRERTMLKQILLHEIAHHFIVTEYPRASRECWLNEGLAGNLEVTVFEDGRFEYPLLNPVLLGIARQAELADPAACNLEKLLSLSWSQFHAEKQKELDYALSWSIVYFLLERELPPSLPLGERIERLYRMDRGEVARLEPRWREFLRTFDLTGKLIEMARAPAESPLGRLTPRWALRQIGSLRFLQEERACEALVGLLEAADPVLRAHASLAFLRLLARHPPGGGGIEACERGRASIARSLLDEGQPAVLREILAGAVGDLQRADRRWVPVLIRLLEDSQGDVRAAAAQGLGALAVKPTIVNPAFWRHGETRAREAEVREWHAWLAVQGEAASPLE